MGIPGPTELLIIAFIVVLLFGARKVPELMGGLGKGLKELKSAVNEEDKNG